MSVARLKSWLSRQWPVAFLVAVAIGTFVAGVIYVRSKLYQIREHIPEQYIIQVEAVTINNEDAEITVMIVVTNYERLVSFDADVIVEQDSVEVAFRVRSRWVFGPMTHSGITTFTVPSRLLSKVRLRCSEVFPRRWGAWCEQARSIRALWLNSGRPQLRDWDELKSLIGPMDGLEINFDDKAWNSDDPRARLFFSKPFEAFKTWTINDGEFETRWCIGDGKAWLERYEPVQ